MPSPLPVCPSGGPYCEMPELVSVTEDGRFTFQTDEYSIVLTRGELDRWLQRVALLLVVHDAETGRAPSP